MLRLLWLTDSMGTSLLRAAARPRYVIRQAAGNAPRGFNLESMARHDHGTGHAKPDESVAAVVEWARSCPLWKAAGRKVLSKVWNREARGSNT